jgi:hypothetical protein
MTARGKDCTSKIASNLYINIYAQQTGGFISFLDKVISQKKFFSKPLTFCEGKRILNFLYFRPYGILALQNLGGLT